jgi:manganese transport protein
MDPGNRGTDLQAGARYKYGLLSVVGLASLMAIFTQMISARLGVVTEKISPSAVATGIPGGPVGPTG